MYISKTSVRSKAPVSIDDREEFAILVFREMFPPATPAKGGAR